jgi:hypothetical protein
MKGREGPLMLKGSHPIQWRDYSELEAGGGAKKFRYALLRVKCVTS